MLSKSKKILSSIFTEVQNVYMQHKPYASTLADLAFKSRLPLPDFPCTKDSVSIKPAQLIVFIVGGATFEEAKDLAVTYNTDKDNVVLGGSSVLNSKTFIADMMTVESQMQAFEVEP
jgi:vacuolar protein sorting-associated protein 45